MRRLAVALICSLISLSAGAQTVDPSRVERINKAFGLEQTLTMVQASSAESLRRQMAVMLKQLHDAGMPSDVVAKIAPYADEMIQRVNSSWDPKVATRIYVEGLTETLTESELADVESYVSSEEGHKSFAAISKSQQAMMQYVQSQIETSSQREMGLLLGRVKEIAAQSRRH
jgi:hypothetical protein